MQRKKYVVLVVLALLLSGCGLKNLTPEELALQFGYDAMVQYTIWHDESLALLANDNFPSSQKAYLATKINPKLNLLYKEIYKYNAMIEKGGVPSKSQINGLITEVAMLAATQSIPLSTKRK